MNTECWINDLECRNLESQDFKGPLKNSLETEPLTFLRLHFPLLKSAVLFFEGTLFQIPSICNEYRCSFPTLQVASVRQLEIFYDGLQRLFVPKARVDNGKCVQECSEGFKEKGNNCVPIELILSTLSVKFVNLDSVIIIRLH